MKLLTIMSSQMEARLFTDHLKAQGLKVVMSGNKEYASIITGQDQGRFEILVTEDDYDKALKVSHELNPHLTLAKNEGETKNNNFFVYYKKSVIFALISIFILPIVFNISSLYYLYQFAKHQELKTLHKSILILVSLILNISFGLIGVFFLYNAYSQGVN